jgi:pseudolysin/vibriolysin
VKLAAGTGDGDLYIKAGSAPTTTSFGWKSTGATNTETISINSPVANTYYIMVYGYSAVSGTTLNATHK